jgi:hydrogenase-4 component E
MQVLGYLVLENGIFLFGMLLLEAMPLLVEAGALLDLFTGVFVMGIIIHQINREFDSVSTEHLAELKE